MERIFIKIQMNPMKSNDSGYSIYQCVYFTLIYNIVGFFFNHATLKPKMHKTYFKKEKYMNTKHNSSQNFAEAWHVQLNLLFLHKICTPTKQKLGLGRGIWNKKSWYADTKMAERLIYVKQMSLEISTIGSSLCIDLAAKAKK